jgi:hypothetical protein
MHLSPVLGIDAARDALGVTERAEVERHLGSGCHECAETVQLWRRLADFALRDADNEPPAAALEAAMGFLMLAGRSDLLRTTEDSVSGAGLIERLVAALLFDSFSQPLAVGVRASGDAARQLLYEAGSFALDLRLESADSVRVLIAGQLAQRGHDLDLSLANVTLDSATTSTPMACNAFGEFAGEFTRDQEWTLSIAIGDEGAILIPLDRLPSPPQARFEPTR